MRNRITLILGWLAATVLSIAIASAAVGSVRNSVTDRPSQLAQPEQVAAAADTPIQPDPVTTSGAPSTTVTVPSTAPTTTTSTSPEANTSTTSAPATSTAPPPPATTTTTTNAPVTTTTTTGAPTQWQLATYESDGGWVRVRHTSEVVELDAAGPAPGFTSKVEKSGPGEVKVEFEDGDEREYSIAIKIEGGRLVVEISSD